MLFLLKASSSVKELHMSLARGIPERIHTKFNKNTDHIERGHVH